MKFGIKSLLSRYFSSVKLKIRGVGESDSIPGLVRGDGGSISNSAIIGVERGGRLQIGHHCYIGRNVQVGASRNMELGDHVSIQDRSIILGDVSIGSYCTFGPNVYVSSGRHVFEVEPHLPIKVQDEKCYREKGDDWWHRRVKIGEDCWIGINASIMPGIEIGRGCVIGANAVVTKNVDPYSIVAGVPAIKIRTRFDFSPPSKIDAENTKQWPYFYSGFEMMSIDEEDAKENGLVSREKFSIYLKLPSDIPDGQARLKLSLRCMNGNRGTVSFEGIVRNIEEEWSIVEWELEHVCSEFHFTVECEAGVGVKSAELFVL